MAPTKNKTLPDEIPAEFKPKALVRAIALEPRILLDAAAVETALDVSEEIALPEITDADSNSLDSLDDPAVLFDSGASESSGSALVFVDTAVEGYEQILEGMDANLEIYFIDSEADGFAQIADILQDRDNISSLHIISHGDDGVLSFGSDDITQANLNDYSDSLTTIASALSEDGDILFYGCNLTASEYGEDFVDALALATGADIAASSDLTGASGLDGNWVLEYESGLIQSSMVVTEAGKNAFKGVLADSWVEDGDLQATESHTSPEDGPLEGGHSIAINQSGDAEEWKFVGNTADNNVYVYRLDSGLGWTLHETISDPEGTGNNFGIDVAAANNKLVVGAPAGGTGNHGRMYIFTYDETNQDWSVTNSVQTVERIIAYGSGEDRYGNDSFAGTGTPNQTAHNGTDNFGDSVDIAWDETDLQYRIVVSNPNEDWWDYENEGWSNNYQREYYNAGAAFWLSASGATGTFTIDNNQGGAGQNIIATSMGTGTADSAGGFEATGGANNYFGRGLAVSWSPDNNAFWAVAGAEAQNRAYVYSDTGTTYGSFYTWNGSGRDGINADDDYFVIDDDVGNTTGLYHYVNGAIVTDIVGASITYQVDVGVYDGSVRIVSATNTGVVEVWNYTDGILNQIGEDYNATGSAVTAVAIAPYNTNDAEIYTGQEMSYSSTVDDRTYGFVITPAVVGVIGLGSTPEGGNSLAINESSDGEEWKFVGNATDNKVYIYKRDADGWVFTEELTGTAGTKFGFDVAAANDRLVVGAPDDDAGDGRTVDGGMYIYFYNGTDWSTVASQYVGRIIAHGSGLDEYPSPNASSDPGWQLPLDNWDQTAHDGTDEFGYNVDIAWDEVGLEYRIVVSNPNEDWWDYRGAWTCLGCGGYGSDENRGAETRNVKLDAGAAFWLSATEAGQFTIDNAAADEGTTKVARSIGSAVADGGGGYDGTANGARLGRGLAVAWSSTDDAFWAVAGEEGVDTASVYADKAVTNTFSVAWTGSDYDGINADEDYFILNGVANATRLHVYTGTGALDADVVGARASNAVDVAYYDDDGNGNAAVVMLIYMSNGDVEAWQYESGISSQVGSTLNPTGTPVSAVAIAPYNTNDVADVGQDLSYSSTNTDTTYDWEIAPPDFVPGSADTTMRGGTAVAITETADGLEWKFVGDSVTNTVFIYMRDEALGWWHTETIATPSGAGSFGYDVAAAHHKLAIGAPTGGTGGHGQMYVYTYDETNQDWAVTNTVQTVERIIAWGSGEDRYGNDSFAGTGTPNQNAHNGADNFGESVDLSWGQAVAEGTVTLTGGASGSVDGITVDGVEIMSGAESFDTDLATTAANVAANINAADLGYSATAVGAVITIRVSGDESFDAFDLVSTTTTLTTTDVDAVATTGEYRIIVSNPNEDWWDYENEGWSNNYQRELYNAGAAFWLSATGESGTFSIDNYQSGSGQTTVATSIAAPHFGADTAGGYEGSANADYLGRALAVSWSSEDSVFWGAVGQESANLVRVFDDEALTASTSVSWFGSGRDSLSADEEYLVIDNVTGNTAALYRYTSATALDADIVTGTTALGIDVAAYDDSVNIIASLSGGDVEVWNYTATAAGTVTLAGASGTVDSITVDGVELLIEPVFFNTDLTTTAVDVADAINKSSSFLDYTATSSGAVVTITAVHGLGTDGLAVESTATTLTTTDANLVEAASGDSTQVGLAMRADSGSNITALAIAPWLVRDNLAFGESVIFSDGTDTRSYHWNTNAYALHHGFEAPALTGVTFTEDSGGSFNSSYLIDLDRVEGNRVLLGFDQNMVDQKYFGYHAQDFNNDLDSLDPNERGLITSNLPLDGSEGRIDINGEGQYFYSWDQLDFEDLEFGEHRIFTVNIQYWDIDGTSLDMVQTMDFIGANGEPERVPGQGINDTTPTEIETEYIYSLANVFVDPNLGTEDQWDLVLTKVVDPDGTVIFDWDDPDDGGDTVVPWAGAPYFSVVDDGSGAAGRDQAIKVTPPEDAVLGIYEVTVFAWDDLLARSLEHTFLIEIVRPNDRPYIVSATSDSETHRYTLDADVEDILDLNDGTTTGTVNFVTIDDRDVAQFANGAATLDFSSVPIEMGDTWAMSMWFRTAPGTFGSSAHYIAADSVNNRHAMVNAAGVIGVDNGGFTAATGGTGGDMTPYDDDAWHHLIIVGDGGNTTFFVDGTLLGVSAAQVTTAVEAVGNDNAGNQSFATYMDDLVFFDGALATNRFSLDTKSTQDILGGDNGTHTGLEFEPDTTDTAIREVALFTPASDDVIDLAANPVATGNDWSLSFYFRDPLEDGVLTSDASGNNHIISNGVGLGLDVGAGYVAVVADASGLGLDDGEWHHFVAVTSGGNTTTFYIDGAAAGTTGTALTTAIETLGNDGGGALTPFASYLDHVTLFHTALTSVQVADVYSEFQGAGTIPQFFYTEDEPIATHEYNDINGLDSTGANNADVTGAQNGTTALLFVPDPLGVRGTVAEFTAASDMVMDLSDDPVVIGSAWSASVWFNDVNNNGVLAADASGNNVIAIDGSGNIGVDNGSGFVSAGSISPWDDGNWHNLIAVGSGGSTEFYIDGELIGTASDQVVTDIVTLGNGSGGASTPFAHYLSKVQLFNSVLSLEEIKQVFAERSNSGIWAGDYFYESDLYNYDTETLTFALGSGTPSWVKIDSATGTLYGTPGNGSLGLNQVTVIGLDEYNTQVSTVVNIYVNNANDQPEVLAINDLSVFGGEEFLLNISPFFSDPDIGDTLTYQLLPENLLGETAGNFDTAIWSTQYSDLGGDGYISDQLGHMRVTTTVEDAVFGARSTAEQTFVLDATKDYTLLFDARSNKADGVLNYMILSGAAVELSGYETGIGEEWASYSITINAGDVASGTYDLMLGLDSSVAGNMNLADWIEFDNVYLYETSATVLPDGLTFDDELGLIEGTVPKFSLPDDTSFIVTVRAIDDNPDDGEPHLVDSNSFFLTYFDERPEAILTNILTGTAAFDEFGHDVSISKDGQVLAVSAPFEGTGGVIRIYDWSDNGTGGDESDDGWVDRGTPILMPGIDTDEYNGFAIDLDLDGNTLVVGARGHGLDEGQAFVYKWAAGWTLSSTIDITSAGSGFTSSESDRFGGSVAINEAGTKILVSATGVDINFLSDAGRVFAYGLDGNGALIGNADFGYYDASGYTDETGTNTASGYTVQANENFGASLAWDASYIAIGAIGTSIGGQGDAGSVYVFEDDVLIERLDVTSVGDEAGFEDYFGWSVDIDGESANGGTGSDQYVLIVGAPGRDDLDIANSGSVYTFIKTYNDGGNFRDLGKVTAPKVLPNDRFGWAVSLDIQGGVSAGTDTDDITNGILFSSSSPFDDHDDVGADFEGSGWSFRYDITNSGDLVWQGERLVAFDADSIDVMGSSVTMAGDVTVLGARVNDILTDEDMGSAYTFNLSYEAFEPYIYGGPVTLSATEGAFFIFGDSVETVGESALSVDDSGVQGEVTLNEDGTVSYDTNGAFDYLSAGERYLETFTYTTINELGDEVVNTINVVITGLNSDIVALDDTAEVIAGESLIMDVLANDADADYLDTLSIESVDTSGILGRVTILEDGTLLYDTVGVFAGLAEGETATETFTYIVTDGSGSHVGATATVTVIGVNDAPHAIFDVAVVGVSDTLVLDVMANDWEFDISDSLTVVSASTSSAALVTINPDGTISYDTNGAFDGLAAGETAEDVITYTIEDSHGEQSTSIVYITVTGEGALADEFTVNEGVDVRVNVLANDAPDSTVTSIDTSGIKGRAVLNPDGTISYFQEGGFENLAQGELASEVIVYTIVTSEGHTSAATLTITIVGANDAPVALPDTITTRADSSAIIDPLSNDYDIDNGDVITIKSVDTSETIGTVDITTDGRLVYNPGNGFDDLPLGSVAWDTFSYIVADSSGALVVQTVTVIVNGLFVETVTTQTTETTSDTEVSAPVVQTESVEESSSTASDDLIFSLLSDFGDSGDTSASSTDETLMTDIGDAEADNSTEDPLVFILEPVVDADTPTATSTTTSTTTTDQEVDTGEPVPVTDDPFDGVNPDVICEEDDPECDVLAPEEDPLAALPLAKQLELVSGGFERGSQEFIDRLMS